MYKIDAASEVEARKLSNGLKSPTYRRLENLESWYNCTQYKGKPNWWDDKCPQWEREPCVVYPIVRMAVEANVDLMLGERAFPSFKGDTIQDIVKDARFKTLAREAYKQAQYTTTAVAVCGIRNGKVFADTIPAKWCEPEFVKSGSFEVKKVTIEYPFIQHDKRKDGTYEAKCYLYRRVIDDKFDTTYKPALIQNENQTEVAWSEDEKVKHGLGFCPVVWYPFMRGCAAVNVIHGNAIHAEHTDEIHAHDLSRSQWHKVALYSEPQVVEVGVSAQDEQQANGRDAVVLSTERGGDAHPTANPVNGSYGGQPQPARKKGMGYTWTYASPEVKVDYLTVPADAVEALSGNTMDLRQRLQEAMGVVFLDPENIKFASVTSGKGLKALRQRHEDRVDQHREDFRDGFIVPVLTMLARVVGKTIDNIEIRWGSYQAPDFGEQKEIVELVNKSKGLVSDEVLRNKLQATDVFEIPEGDDDAELPVRNDTRAVLEELEILGDIEGIESKTLKIETILMAARSALPHADETVFEQIRAELEAAPESDPHESDDDDDMTDDGNSD